MVTRVRLVLARFGWRQWLLAVVFLVAVAAAGLFAVRTVVNMLYWSQHHDEPIERWMPVNYIAHSYDVPPEVLWNALDLPDPRTERRRDFRPLSEIAETRGQSFEEVRALLERAITGFRASPRPQGGAQPPAPRDDRGSDRGVP